ncbi:unnamed protein product [Spirodela intermedia]|uniref:DUF7036 domain-containing protein n=1 Tax=Spirodela intermedia TaxID=51605 RepID=A0A7I8KUS7_SPIIN|nr:unnamed protein product [Spirodela intermedia]
MGKPIEDDQEGLDDPGNGTEARGILFCRCSEGIRGIRNAFSCRCVVLLLLSAGVLLSAVFWLPPLRGIGSGSDSGDGEDFSASIQASFVLQKPLSLVSSYSAHLEYDIFEEIGVPNTKVSIIDMSPLTSLNSTYVVFGVLPNPKDAVISPIVLSVLRSSLIELVLQESNLSLTTSIFGHPSSFEVLKFPGGITVIPIQSASIWQMSQVLFNFTLNNSITQIQRNLDELKGQLKYGLNLRSYENVYVQMTNLNGSSASPPVIVEASVLSDVGSRNLLPPRLKQLAQTITGPPENLGLDHSVFGKVKEVRLSSYLNDSITSLEGPSPSPSKSYEYPFFGPSISPSSAPPPLTDLAPSPSTRYRASSPFGCPPLQSAAPGERWLKAPPPQPSGAAPSSSITPPARGPSAPRKPWLSPKISPGPSPVTHSAPPPHAMAALLPGPSDPPPNMAPFPGGHPNRGWGLSPALSPQQDQGSGKVGKAAESPASVSSSPSDCSLLHSGQPRL